MKKKLLDLTKNFSYTFTSNVFSMLVSIIVTLIIPKLISVEQYGFYQIYIFYIGYAWLACFGLCDGIYLRTGGKYYQDVDKPVYGSQFWLLALFEFVFLAVIFVVSSAFVKDTNTKYIVFCTCFVTIEINMRNFIAYILMATARIKEYAVITISEKIIFGISIIILMLVRILSFRWVVVANILSVSICLCIEVWYCHDIVFTKLLPVRSVINEVRINCSAGVRLMFASLCSMLIIGVVRFGVKNHWDIATFGKVSLTLSLSNMVMTAINAIAVVMYPMLRRTNEDSLPKIYGIMRVLLMGIIFGGIVFYYPAYKILSLWLPQYAASLRYAAILLPMCAYESKMSLLVNTYYKTLRLENLLMKCNMAALGLSVVLTLVSTLVLNSVTAAIISILIVLIFRCVLSEIILSTKMPIKVIKDIVIELIMTVAFIICNWFFGVWGMIAYFICYLIYISLKRNDIKETLTFIRSMR